MAWTQDSWWSFNDSVKKALAELAAETGKDIVYLGMREDGHFLDVSVDGQKLVLTQTADVRSDFQDDPKGSRRDWPPILKESYRRQIENRSP